MKLNVKPFSKFVNESDDQEQELRDLGFQDRQELSSSEEIEDTLNDLFFRDPELNAAWTELTTKLSEKLDKFKSEYTWNPEELESIADYYLDAVRDYASDGLDAVIAGSLKDIADEGDL
jgi:hypothetical protein